MPTAANQSGKRGVYDPSGSRSLYGLKALTHPFISPGSPPLFPPEILRGILWFESTSG
jgi:hypothetical protein